MSGLFAGSTDVDGMSGKDCPNASGVCAGGSNNLNPCGCLKDCPGGACTAPSVIGIFDCGPETPPVCHDGIDTLIGKCQKCKDGTFDCPLFTNIVLQPKEIIYATDNCYDPMRIGPDVVIPQPPAVPLLSPALIVLLAGTLGLIGLLSLARLRWNK